MPQPPLLVHLLFHPDSQPALALAQHIHRQLNDDVVVPGLRVPTVFLPLDEGNRPARPLRLDIAQRSFVVPLADDFLCINDDWCAFVGDIWAACEDSPHRFVPIQLSASAWPLDDRLREVSFARAYVHPEGDRRNAWVVRRIVIELCRYLQKEAATDDRSRAPIELFLSHAKIDLDAEPQVTRRLIDYLKADQPVDAWIDSGEIETGSKFAEAIARGVRRTSLLAVLTDNYSSREWCREEVMLAKEHQRPIAVIDALMTHEVRSFPFLENVPKLRWNGTAEASVDLLLKETLRHLHTEAVLAASKRDGDTLFLRPPEPATLLDVPRKATILYPDPPLGVGELNRLSKLQMTFTTPMQRLAEDRSLEGKLIALSMSESTDIGRWGMDLLHLEQTMLELSRYLLIRGASLAYGDHVGREGYTQRLFELVRAHNSREGAEPFERIVNHRGWPLPRLIVAERARWKQVATIVELPRPTDVDESLHGDFVPEPTLFWADQSPAHRYAWSRGMTELRVFQADRVRSNVVARIVLGGTFGPTLKAVEGGVPKQSWYAGRMPGVLEEVLLSIKAGQPVFLIGAFGGAAKLVIDLLLGRGHPAANWAYQSKAPLTPETRDMYNARGQRWWYYADEPQTPGLAAEEPRPIVEFLADAWKPRADTNWETGINPLTREENIELFETVDLGRMSQLIEIGMRAMS
jgi:hypothetical protein